MVLGKNTIFFHFHGLVNVAQFWRLQPRGLQGGMELTLPILESFFSHMRAANKNVLRVYLALNNFCRYYTKFEWAQMSSDANSLAMKNESSEGCALLKVNSLLDISHHEQTTQQLCKFPIHLQLPKRLE